MSIRTIEKVISQGFLYCKVKVFYDGQKGFQENF